MGASSVLVDRELIPFSLAQRVRLQAAEIADVRRDFPPSAAGASFCD
jgi:hypothetical protein